MREFFESVNWWNVLTLGLVLVTLLFTEFPQLGVDPTGFGLSAIALAVLTRQS